MNGGGEYAEDNMTILDTLTCNEEDIPECKIMAESKHTELYSVIARLDEREQEVLRAYFGLGGSRPMTLEEIGEMCDLTRERVRQIKETALRRLRRSSNQTALRAYLG
jgi:RNA polymerase primary sigma factor